MRYSPVGTPKGTSHWLVCCRGIKLQLYNVYFWWQVLQSPQSLLIKVIKIGLTKAAAIAENCEGKYCSFQDVIII